MLYRKNICTVLLVAGSLARLYTYSQNDTRIHPPLWPNQSVFSFTYTMDLILTALAREPEFWTKKGHVFLETSKKERPGNETAPKKSPFCRGGRPARQCTDVATRTAMYRRSREPDFVSRFINMKKTL